MPQLITIGETMAAFTPDSVKLEGYQCHPLDQAIPVAV